MSPTLLSFPEDYERLVPGSEPDDVDEFGRHPRVLAGVIQGVVIADAERRILAVNPTFERTSGYSASELVGRNCRLLQGADTDPATIQKSRSSSWIPPFRDGTGEPGSGWRFPAAWRSSWAGNSF